MANMQPHERAYFALGSVQTESDFRALLGCCQGTKIKLPIMGIYMYIIEFPSYSTLSSLTATQFRAWSNLG